MQELDIARQAHNVKVWSALKEIAERHGIKKNYIAVFGIGQLITSVVRNDDNTNSVFAGRCGWHSSGERRIVTDVTSFLWLEDAVDPLNAVRTYPYLWVSATRPAFACDSDRQARALAALASENDALPNIERMIDHER